MGTDREHPPTSTGLFGKTRQAILSLLYGHHQEAFYLRQIVRFVSIGQGTVQRELAHLAAAGLLVRTRRGNQVYYQANSHSPLFPELKSLITKTTGVADLLRAALIKFSDRIRVAFLYGSLATGTDRVNSDVDLFVVGKVTFGEVVDAVETAQEKLGREVNPSIYSIEEFKKKLCVGHHFLKTVWNGPKIFLIGDQHELERMGSKRLADRT